VRRLWFGVSQASSRHRDGTYAANSGHRDVARAPRSESDPLELNWLPARERSVVVAGIVSGCADFSARAGRYGGGRDLVSKGCGLLRALKEAGHT
jgi:hypothetical protein